MLPDKQKWLGVSPTHRQRAAGLLPCDLTRRGTETNKPSGKRFTMDEVGLFTVDNGKIVKEEFFYAMG